MNMSNCSILRNTTQRVVKNLFFKDISVCNASSRAEIVDRQNSLFNLEKKRQREAIGRIEKINVKYEGQPEKVDLVMNKNISTPYDCARHISETLMQRSAVALLNGETLWHMHRPIPESCSLDFLHFTIQQPGNVNKIFWRTCSFLLGATASVAFKDKINVALHSFPIPNVRSGSFVYDVELGLDKWTPTQDELRVLSIEMIKIIQKNLPLEYLSVNKDLALEIFKDSPHKFSQIPDIAEHNEQNVPLFRAGDFIDISRGPMLANTSLIGRCTIAAVHKLQIPGNIYRFQGVALPQAIRLNHFAYNILEERAKNLNNARLPNQDAIIEEHPVESRVTQ